MVEENHEIILPKELQKQMIKFFQETSMPRIKKEKDKKLLFENEPNGGEETEE